MKKLPPQPKHGKKLNAPCVIYARYSSRGQNDMSIEQQVEKDEALATTYGLKVLRIYADRAISGKTDKRPEFQKMLRDAESGEFSYVIAWKSSRIGRNMMEALINETRLRDLGVRIVYVEEEFEDNAAGRFAARNMMNVNQFYSESMAEDVVRGLRANAQQCKANSGSLPLGYKKGTDKRFEVDEATAPLVQEIFRRVADGEAYSDIAADLNRRGIPTSQGHRWNKNSFRTMLSNRRYLGIYIYDDIEIEGGVPRLISDEMFARVQVVVNTKKTKGRTTDGDYLLTGKLYCGECGDAMVGVSGTGKSGDTYYYYACRNHLAKNCKKRNIRRDDIEQAVAKLIQEHILDDEVSAWIVDSMLMYQEALQSDPDLQLLKDKLDEVKKTLANVMKAIDAGLITDGMREHLEQLEAEKRELTQKINAAQYGRHPYTREQLERWLNRFKHADLKDRDDRRALFDTFLTAVYVYEGRKARIRIDLGRPEDSDTIDFDFRTADLEDDAGVLIDSSDPCHARVIRTHRGLYMINGVFVMDFSF